MPDTTFLIERCKQLDAQGKGQEELVLFLRSQGSSKVESIVILTKALAISIGKAKEAVHLSKAWADTRERDDQFHEALYKSVKDLEADDSTSKRFT